MAFQIKNFISIVAGMINHVRGTSSKLTDFNVGSINRTLVESPAVEIEELYLQMVNGLVESIPVAIYQAFNFTKLPAAASVGTIKFTANPAPVADISIPAGTTVLVPLTSKTYETVEAAVIPAGQTEVSVQIQSTVTGVDGNALAGTITQLQYAIAGITGVTNDVALTSGRDEETDLERKTRFQAYISNLARATLGAIEYSAKTAYITDGSGTVIEYVDRVGLVELVPGRVACYIYNGSGGTSDALVDRAQEIIDGYTDPDSGAKIPGYRAGGVMVEVIKMTETPIALTAVITLDAGYSLNAAMVTAITTAFSDYLAEVPQGDTFYLAELTARIQNVEGVKNAAISAPDDDIVVAANTALTQGAVTLS